jgi:hypothetical protein
MKAKQPKGRSLETLRSDARGQLLDAGWRKSEILKVIPLSSQGEAVGAQEECVCSEINARNCPVHSTKFSATAQNDKPTAGTREDSGDGGALCEICGHEWRRHDPEDGRCDAGPACFCGHSLYEMRLRIAELSQQALQSCKETTK